MKSEEITIFISHTDETEEECEIVKSVINDQLTQKYFSRYGYKFNPICWKDVLPGVGEPQKDKIDPYIIDSNCKLVVMIFWTRYCGSRHNTESGMEYEYELAKKYQKDIWLYFSDRKIRPSQIQPEQLAKVKEFMERTKSENLHADVYPTKDRFRDRFRIQLIKWGEKYIEVNRLQDKFRSQTRGF